MLDYNLLMQEIRDIKNCYFIYSYDDKLVKNFLKSIENILILRDLKEFNYISLKFDTTFDINYFFEICNTIPMMQEKKIVILENSLFLKNDYDNKELLSKLREYLKTIPQYCVIICYYIYKEQDRTKDNLKSFSNYGQICKIQELKGEDLVREVSKIFESRKVNISNHLIKYFCDRVCNDFFHITNEIDKLKIFVGDNIVTKESIDDIVPKSLENNIFTFINGVLDKNIKKSLIILKELMINNNEINHILRMLNNQFSKFLDVKMLLDVGLSSQEIINKIRINQYVLNNFIKISHRYSLQEVINIIDNFLDLEYKLRSNSNVDAFSELEILLVSICK